MDWTRTVLAALAVMTLCSCESLQGSPLPIDPSNPPSDTCPTPAMITAYNALAATATNPTRRELRDADIGICVSLIDGQYNSFVRKLHSQNTSTTLGLDLVALGLTSGGSVASKATANALSAAASGVTGAGLAVNKDVFYQKTLPAIIAQMDANRAAIYSNMRLSMQSDETVYTLADAQHDLRLYEGAGTIDAAVAAISGSAQQSTDKSTAAVKALFVGDIVDAATQARKKALAQYVKGLDPAVAADKANLDKLAAAFAVPVSPGEDPLKERHDLLVALDQSIIDQASMDKAAATVKAAVKKDF